MMRTDLVETQHFLGQELRLSKRKAGSTKFILLRHSFDLDMMKVLEVLDAKTSEEIKPYSLLSRHNFYKNHELRQVVLSNVGV